MGGVSWWRMAFIFGPAIARGDISSFGLYTPFIFGRRAPVDDNIFDALESASLESASDKRDVTL
jgi:hypothetical protein